MRSGKKVSFGQLSNTLLFLLLLLLFFSSAARPPQGGLVVSVDFAPVFDNILTQRGGGAER
jgi:hypothetical protein